MLRTVMMSALAFVIIAPGTAADAIAQELAVVTRHVVYPGQKVSEDAIEIVDASNCQNCDAGFINDASAVIGRLAVKTLTPGRLIFPGDLRIAPAMMRGEEVKVLYRNGALQISMSGIALGEAATGEAVSIRNVTSGAIISGVVQADGTVMVRQ